MPSSWSSSVSGEAAGAILLLLGALAVGGGGGGGCGGGGRMIDCKWNAKYVVLYFRPTGNSESPHKCIHN